MPLPRLRPRAGTRHLPLPAQIIAIVEEEEARDPVREPTGKETRRETHNVVKDVDPRRKNERNTDTQRRQRDPHPPPEHGMRMQMP